MQSCDTYKTNVYHCEIPSKTYSTLLKQIFFINIVTKCVKLKKCANDKYVHIIFYQRPCPNEWRLFVQNMRQLATFTFARYNECYNRKWCYNYYLNTHFYQPLTTCSGDQYRCYFIVPGMNLILTIIWMAHSSISYLLIT